MVNQQRSPILSRSKVKLGRVIGQGQKIKKSLPVQEAYLIEEVPNDRKRRIFPGVLKRLVPSMDYHGVSARQAAINAQLAWRAFKEAGLPVPNFAKLDLRTTSPNYLTIFYENIKKRHGLEFDALTREYGKLYDCHRMGDPVFFKNFTLPQHSKIITLTAKDLAKIHSLGFSTHNIDFWHFYKKANSYDRVIIDFEGFAHADRGAHINRMIDNIYDIGLHLKEKEFKLFIEAYLRNQPDKIIADSVRRQYAQDKFQYLDSRYVEG